MELSITFFFFNKSIFTSVCNYLTVLENILVARQAGFIKHFLIHILHIYLRVNIRKADTGQFVDFISHQLLHRNVCQPFLHPRCSWVLTAGQCPATLETQECLL